MTIYAIKRVLFSCFISPLCLFLPGMCFGNDWSIHSIDKEGKGADGIRLADVNNDGLLDIATGWEEEGETRIYLHPGYKNVKKPWPKVMVGKSQGVEDALFFDIDSDGSSDVVSSCESGAIIIHWAPKKSDLYLEKGAWETEILPLSQGIQKWMIATPFRIDKKNGVGLLAAGKGKQIVWFSMPESQRDLSNGRKQIISISSGWTMSLLAIDMDGDGDQDAVQSVRTGNPGVRWFENPGFGVKQENYWAVHEVGPKGTAFGFIKVVDFDGDGYKDIIAPAMSKKTVMIFRGLNQKATQWQIIDIPVPNSRNKGIASGDIDLDGQMDLALTHEFSGAAWLSHNGNIESGHWTYHKVGDGNKLDNLELFDADGDGDLDMFSTDERGAQVIWYENPVSGESITPE